MMKNKIAYDVAKEIGIKYAVDSEYIDLYINGEYLGLYLLCEKVEVAENRVNITDLNELNKSVNQFSLSTYKKVYSDDKVFYSLENNPDNITGGYLIEYQYDMRKEEQESLFSTKGGLNFSLECPRYASKKEINYISNFYQQLENNLSSDDYKKYIDEDSWVRFYLVQECLGNTDLGSEYFFIDQNDNKLYAGPIWDFDMCMGGFTTEVTSDVRVLFTCKDHFLGKSVFKSLYDNPIFIKKIVSGYKKLMRPIIVSIKNKKIDFLSKNIKESFYMNKIRWNLTDVSLKNECDVLKKWTDEKTKFLDDIWINGEKFFRVMLQTEKPFVNRYCYSIKPNERISELPNLSLDGYTFNGWYDFYTEEKVEKHEKITEDRLLKAKWTETGDIITHNNYIIDYARKNIQLLLFTTIFVLLIFFVIKDVSSNKKEKK